MVQLALTDSLQLALDGKSGNGGGGRKMKEWWILKRLQSENSDEGAGEKWLFSSRAELEEVLVRDVWGNKASWDADTRDSDEFLIQVSARKEGGGTIFDAWTRLTLSLSSPLPLEQK